MNDRVHSCPAGERTVLVRNVAARGLVRTFDLRLRPASEAGRPQTRESAALPDPATAGEGWGVVEVRRGMLPFFWFASREQFPAGASHQVERRFMDASFELAVVATVALEATLS